MRRTAPSSPPAVVVPTHNRRALLAETVDSVLRQAHDLHLVVVDDGSTDGTGAYLRQLTDPRVTVVTQSPAQERAAARNAGMRATAATWVLFLDDDDLLAPGAIEALANAAAAAPPDAVAVVGRLAFFDAGGRRSPERWVRRPWTGSLLADSVLDPYLGPNRALLRRSAVEAAGGWSSRHPPFEDYLLSLRLAAQGPAVVIPEMVVWRRLHGSQSDLRHSDRRRAEIRSEVAAVAGRAAAAIVERRATALERLFAAHRTRPSGIARVRAALAVAAADPTFLASPIGRRTVGVMVLRLLLTAALPAAIRRRRHR